MKKFLASMSAIACLSLVLMVPVFAHGTVGTAGNGLNANGTYNSGYSGINGTLTNNGNTMLDRTIGTRTGTNGTNMGTNNYGTFDTNRMNMNDTNGNRTRTNNYRATAATTDNDFDWGWLGLLGLIGLAGMRGKNRDEVR